MFSTGIPSTSAACIEIEVLVPPMSVEPSTKLKVPSAFTANEQLDCLAILNQNPDATPLP